MSRFVPALLLLVVSLAPPLLADDGELDPSFWMDGTVAVDGLTANATFGGLASDVEGQLAVAYSYVPPTGAVEVAVWRRVNDSSLGAACVVEPYLSGVRDTRVFDIAFDAYDRLLVLARESYVDPVMGAMEAWYLLAYSYPDCTLETAFSGDGIAALYGWDMAGLNGSSRLRPLADGQTLVTGAALSGGPAGCRVHVIVLEPNGGTASTYCAPPDAFPVEAYGKDSVMMPNGHLVSIAGYDDFYVVDFDSAGTVASVTTVAFDLPGGISWILRNPSPRQRTARSWSPGPRKAATAGRTIRTLRSRCCTGTPRVSSSSTRTSRATES